MSVAIIDVKDLNCLMLVMSPQYAMGTDSVASKLTGGCQIK